MMLPQTRLCLGLAPAMAKMRPARYSCLRSELVSKARYSAGGHKGRVVGLGHFERRSRLLVAPPWRSTSVDGAAQAIEVAALPGKAEAVRRYSEGVSVHPRRARIPIDYLAGRIFAMAGASPKHNLVCGNIIRALGERLRARRCAVMPSDQHVYVQATGLGTYPDVTVLCGPGQLHKDFPQSLVNPSILVEVLSVSTEAYDCGAKLTTTVASRPCASMSSSRRDRLAVDHDLQEADGTWRLTVSRGLDAQLRLPSVDATVPLSEMDQNIDLVAPEGIEEASPYPPEVKVPKRSWTVRVGLARPGCCPSCCPFCCPSAILGR